MANVDGEGTELICNICFGEFEDAVIIQCHHSFCRQCITKWINRTKSGQGTFTCPNCKSVNQATSLQKSFPVEQMRSLIQKNKMHTSSYPHCKAHPDEDLRFYCRNCKTTVCRDCKVVKQHQNHDFETIKTIASEMQSEIKQNIDAVYGEIQNLKVKTSDIDMVILDVEREEELAIMNCYKRSDELKADIETLIAITVDKIKDKVNTELGNYKESKRVLESDIQNNKIYIEQLNQLCVSDNATDVLSNFHQMKRSAIHKDTLIPNLSRMDHQSLFESSETNLTHLQAMIGRVPDSVDCATKVSPTYRPGKSPATAAKQVRSRTPFQAGSNPATVVTSVASCTSTYTHLKPVTSWRDMLKPVITTTAPHTTIFAKPFNSNTTMHPETETIAAWRNNLKPVNPATETNPVTSYLPISTRTDRTTLAKPNIAAKPVTSRRSTYVPTVLCKVLPASTFHLQNDINNSRNNSLPEQEHQPPPDN